MNEMQQRGPNAALKYFLAMLAGLGVILAALIGSYISAANYGAAMEASIKAAHRDNQNILSNYSNQIREAVQVSEIARDHIVEIAKAAMEGRYGDAGAKAVFQAIQEHNPAANDEVYATMHRLIEAGRNEFKVAQTRLIDFHRTYETAQGQFLRGRLLKAAGYPKINLEEYGIITNDYASEAFRAGKESGPIQLRSAPKAAAAQSGNPAPVSGK